MTRLGATLREVVLPHVVNVRRRTGSIEEVNVMDGDLGHSSRLRDGGQYHMPSGAAYGPFSSHVCTATMALAVHHDTAVSGEGDPITD